MPAETHSHRDIDREYVRNTVIENAAELLGADPEELDESTTVTDPGPWLAELVDLCSEDLIERASGLSDDDIADCRTLGDVIDLIGRYAGVPE